MAYMTMPNTNKNKIDLRKMRKESRTISLINSTTSLTDGEEIELITRDITNGGYLTLLDFFPGSISTIFADDASTKVHCCLGLEFNVYIDDELFQTIRLSHALSGTPSSSVNLSSYITSYYRYKFVAKETTTQITKNSSNTFDIGHISTQTNNPTTDNVLNFNIYTSCTLCGITNGESSRYVGYADPSHIASNGINNYCTVFPMVKINNNIRATVKYLFFNNASDSTNEASFHGVRVQSAIAWIPINQI